MKLFFNIYFMLLILCDPLMALTSTPFNQQTWPSKLTSFSNNSAGVKSLFVVPHSRLRTPKSSAFSLFKNQQITHTDFLKNLLKEQGMPIEFNIEQKASYLGSLLVRNQVRHHKYVPTLQQIAFCDQEIGLIQLEDNSIGLQGQVLTPRAYDSINNEDVLIDRAILNIERQFAASIGLLEAKVCWLVSDRQLQKVQLVTIQNKADGLNYKAYVNNDQVIQIKPIHFHTKATAVTYLKNPIDGQMQEYILDLNGDGSTLINNHFESKPARMEPANEPTAHFEYDPDSPHFDEVHIFVHATRMYNWFADIGYEWQGPRPMQLISHARINNNINNALYQPSPTATSGYPKISIGDGDGIILQNLGKDVDVVAHEFSHHVIFSTLKDTIGESLVLHEGLADFFTFMQSEDTCLGESICPEGSRICWSPGSCLRTAENSIAYLSSEYNDLEPHLKGQLVSGTLWDLGAEIGLSQVTSLVYTAISFFLENSGMQDFVFALFMADKTLNDSANSCAIYDALESRGFSGLLADIDCLNLAEIPPLVGSTTSGFQSAEPKHSSTSSDDGYTFCASIHDSSSSSATSYWFLLFFPLLASLRKRNLSS